MVTPEDLRLIELCLSGEARAFGSLVDRYQDQLFSVLFRCLGNREDAQDVVQEAFVKAYLSLPSFRREAQFFSWLCTIAFNAATSLRRERRPVVSLDADPNGGILGRLRDSSVTNCPSHNVEVQEQAEGVRRALNRLSPEHRAVLVLKEIDGQKYSEIAESLRVPVGTVRSRLHRARMELRELLQQEEI